MAGLRPGHFSVGVAKPGHFSCRHARSSFGPAVTLAVKLGMTKLDIAELHLAYEGKSAA